MSKKKHNQRRYHKKKGKNLPNVAATSTSQIAQRIQQNTEQESQSSDTSHAVLQDITDVSGAMVRTATKHRPKDNQTANEPLATEQEPIIHSQSVSSTSPHAKEQPPSHTYQPVRESPHNSVQTAGKATTASPEAPAQKPTQYGDAPSKAKQQQKRAIKKSYQKRKHESSTITETVVTEIKKVMEDIKKATDALLGDYASIIWWIVGGLALLTVIFIAMAQSYGVLLSGGAYGIAGVSSTYTTDTDVMLSVEADYSAFESSLQATINNMETAYPNYDEYVYNIDPIGHSPHELASYLSALYINYTNTTVDADLSTLYTMQYELTIVASTRKEKDEDGDDVTIKVLTVTVVNKGLEQAITQLLTTEQLELYYLYLNSQGGNPLLFGGGSTSNVPDTDLSGVTFVDGERVGNETIVYIAQTQVGSINDGGEKFWSWYGFTSREPWCACFVSWVLNQAGYSEPVFASCQYGGVPYFVSNGRWATSDYEDIAAGDVIFFDWGGDGISDHVGIVVGTDGSRVYTIEGNSSDGVHVRDYDLNSNVIMGYGLM